ARQMVRFGFAAPEPAAFWPRSVQPECPAQAARPEPAVQQAVRLGPSAAVASAAPPEVSLAWLVLWEAAPPPAGSGASRRAGRVATAAWGAAAELRSAEAPLAAPEGGAARRQEARAAAEVQHGAALRERPSAEDPSVPPSEAAFHAPSRAHLAPARSE